MDSKGLGDIGATCQALLGKSRKADFEEGLETLEAHLQGERNSQQLDAVASDRETQILVLLVLIRGYGRAIKADDVLELTHENTKDALLLIKGALRKLQVDYDMFDHEIIQPCAATLIRLTLELGHASTVFGAQHRFEEKNGGSCALQGEVDTKIVEGKSEADTKKPKESLNVSYQHHYLSDCINDELPMRQCMALFAQHLRILCSSCSQGGGILDMAAQLMKPWWSPLQLDNLRHRSSFDNFIELCHICMLSTTTFHQAASRRDIMAPLLRPAIDYAYDLVLSKHREAKAASNGVLQRALWACVLITSREENCKEIKIRDPDFVSAALDMSISSTNTGILETVMRLTVNIDALENKGTPSIQSFLVRSLGKLPTRLRERICSRIQSSSASMVAPLRKSTVSYRFLMDHLLGEDLECTQDDVELCF